MMMELLTKLNGGELIGLAGIIMGPLIAAIAIIRHASGDGCASRRNGGGP